MPIYEYICHDCGDEFEVLVRNGEKPTCPSCGRERLTKKLSVPAAHVAGAPSPLPEPRKPALAACPTAVGRAAA